MKAFSDTSIDLIIGLISVQMKKSRESGHPTHVLIPPLTVCRPLTVATALAAHGRAGREPVLRAENSRKIPERHR